MLLSSRIPLQVGVVPWNDDNAAQTVIVKRTYDLVPRGTATLCAEQDSLRLDTVRGGVLLHPSDFAPAKSLCDVVLVGSALEQRIGPVRLALDPLRKLVERADQLGARPGVGADGDPTDPDLLGAWASASFDFEAFQCAPRDQRVTPLAMPFGVTLDYGETRFVTRVEGRAPEAVVIDQYGWSPPTPVPLRADLVALDPERRRVMVVWRGIVAIPEGADPLLAVEATVPIRSLSPRDMLAWPRTEPIDPSLLRRLASFAASAQRTHGPRGTAAMARDDDDVGASTLTLRKDSSDEAMERTATSQMPAVHAALPPMPARATLPDIPDTVRPPAPSPGTIPLPRATRPPPEDDGFELPTSTVVTQLPASLQALPFSPDPPARPRLETVVDDDSTMSRPQGTRPPLETFGEDPLSGTVAVVTAAPAALPFERKSAHTVPLPVMPPARHTFSTALDLDDHDPLASTHSVPVSPARAALPFRHVEDAAAPTAPARRPTVDLDDAPIGTGTVDLDVRAIRAMLGDELDATRRGAPPALHAPPLAPPLVPAMAPPLAPPLVAPPPPVPPPPPVLPSPGMFAAIAEAATEPTGYARPQAARAGVLIGVAARLGAPASESAAPLVERPPTVPPPAAARPADTDSAERIKGLTAEQFAEIKAKLWSGRGKRRATLAAYGLSELQWRLVEKRFTADLAKRRPEEARIVVGRLRAAKEARLEPSSDAG